MTTIKIRANCFNCSNVVGGQCLYTTQTTDVSQSHGCDNYRAIDNHLLRCTHCANLGYYMDGDRGLTCCTKGRCVDPDGPACPDFECLVRVEY